MPTTSWSRIGVLAAVLLSAGCHASVGELTGQASDEWVRSYELAAGREIQITNANGPIELEGHDGSTVEVRAERTARALNDDSARELVSRIAIREEVTPERVAIRTEGISGLLIGVSYLVKYHVRAPHAVVARLRVTNGVVTAKGFRGHLIATSTNGGIAGEDLGGRIEARATNGHIRITATGVAAGGIDLRTTNGRVDLALPDTAKADLSAECRNGTVSVDGLRLEPFGEQSNRTVAGKLNGGGPPIDISTTNGAIRVRSAAAAAEP